MWYLFFNVFSTLQVDAEKLCDTFGQLGFDVDRGDNFNEKDVWSVLLKCKRYLRYLCFCTLLKCTLIVIPCSLFEGNWTET